MGLGSFFSKKKEAILKAVPYILGKLDMRSINKIFTDNNLELIGTKETVGGNNVGGSNVEYTNFTLKIPFKESITINNTELYLDGVYILLRLGITGYRYNVYFKFKDDILTKLGMTRQLSQLIVFIHRGEAPYFINSISEVRTIIRMNLENNWFSSLEMNSKYTDDDYITKLNEQISNLSSKEKIEELSQVIITELSKFRKGLSNAAIAAAKRKAEAEAEAEGKRKIAEFSLNHYKKIVEDIDDYLVELLDMCIKRSNYSIDKYGISYSILIEEQKAGNRFEFNDKYDSVMRALLQARKRIKDRYSKLSIDVEFISGNIILRILDNEFNNKLK